MNKRNVKPIHISTNEYCFADIEFMETLTNKNINNHEDYCLHYIDRTYRVNIPCELKSFSTAIYAKVTLEKLQNNEWIDTEKIWKVKNNQQKNGLNISFSFNRGKFLKKGLFRLKLDVYINKKCIDIGKSLVTYIFENIKMMGRIPKKKKKSDEKFILMNTHVISEKNIKEIGNIEPNISILDNSNQSNIKDSFNNINDIISENLEDEKENQEEWTSRINKELNEVFKKLNSELKLN